MVDSGAAEDVMPRSMFPEFIHRVRTGGKTISMKITTKQHDAHQRRMKLRGEKSQELANLELPDGEGEWCWPKTNPCHQVKKSR